MLFFIFYQPFYNFDPANKIINGYLKDKNVIENICAGQFVTVFNHLTPFVTVL